MPYTYATLAQVRIQLASKLYDTGATQFWSDAEKNLYIYEALRTWNSLTGMWRIEFPFPVSQGLNWYDIPSAVGSPRPYTLADNDLIQIIEYHLLEPATPTYPLVWTGSLQLSMTDILNAIQRRRDEVLSMTACTTTRQLVMAVPSRIYLSDNSIDIRRIAWLPVQIGKGYSNVPLWPDDMFGIGAYERDFTVAGEDIPTSYQRNVEPPLSFDVDVTPPVNGQYDVLTVNAGPMLSVLTPTILGIPDDFAWVIKWGVLADLLSRESNAKDELRAKYCEMRYQQGIAALRIAPSILYARVDNIPMDVQSVQDLDNFRPTWQAEPQQMPDTIATAGLNMLTLAPAPDIPYDITIGVVSNAPIPANDGDLVQVSREDLEALGDYAQHIASFKMGGSEFMSTIPLLDRFHKRAALYNSKLNELGEYTKPTYDLGQLQSEANPVFEQDPGKE